MNLKKFYIYVNNRSIYINIYYYWNINESFQNKIQIEKHRLITINNLIYKTLKNFLEFLFSIPNFNISIDTNIIYIHIHVNYIFGSGEESARSIWLSIQE